MARRPDVTLLSLRHSKTNGVSNLAGSYLVIADQARQNGQSRGIRRCPTDWTQDVRFQVEDSARTGHPCAVGLRIGRPCFVEYAIIVVDNQNVTVALAGGSALNWRPGRNRIRTAIALVTISETDRDF